MRASRGARRATGGRRGLAYDGDTIRREEPSVSTPFDDGASTPAGAGERETLTWDGFGSASRELARAVVQSGWRPDLIVAIARGGLLPAGAIAYAMGVKAIGTVNVEFYTDIGHTLPEPVLLPPLMDVSSLHDKRVLVVDDVADSGRTLNLVMHLIRERGMSLEGAPAVPVEARCAVIYVKPTSVIEPDYLWRRTAKWINFPWSTLPVIVPDCAPPARRARPLAGGDAGA